MLRRKIRVFSRGDNNFQTRIIWQYLMPVSRWIAVVMRWLNDKINELLQDQSYIYICAMILFLFTHIIVLSFYPSNSFFILTSARYTSNPIDAFLTLSNEDLFHIIQYSLVFIIIIIWRRHPMETFSALLVICAGNSPVPGEFPTLRPVTWSFDVFFDLRLNKRLSKQWWGWWFGTLSRPLWRHRKVIPMPLPVQAAFYFISRVWHIYEYFQFTQTYVLDVSI